MYRFHLRSRLEESTMFRRSPQFFHRTVPVQLVPFSSFRVSDLPKRSPVHAPLSVLLRALPLKP
uniref:Uncharacterized protein n=1 Tax=Ascaris lumbricoides TaxID=6252 RepID=A0A0M3IL92_ASCLU